MTTSFSNGSALKNSPAKRKNQVWSLVWEDSLEKEMATHSSILAWEIPWTEEPGRLQPIRPQTVGHDLVTKQGGFRKGRGTRHQIANIH